jgi:hypothetical protein
MKPEPSRIREMVAQVFQELGAKIDDLGNLGETLLIDDGRCAARSYCAGDLMAMWLVEVGVLQFYDGSGSMLRTFSLSGEKKPRRKAA